MLKMPVILTDENFEEEILDAKKPVLVDFWMQGCGPCFLISPILEKLAQEFEEKIVLAKVNLDDIPLTSQKYGITVVPTIVLFREGKPISGFIGLRPEPIIRQWLEENLRSDAEKVQKIVKECEKYADENGLKLNPDRGVVEKIVKGLLENEKKYKARYCPCRRITGNQEEDKKIICPCVYHLEEIEKEGHCLCGLFVKKIIE